MGWIAISKGISPKIFPPSIKKLTIGVNFVISRRDMDTLIASPSSGLKGKMACPGDKSMSHRALIFGGMAMGQTHIEGLLCGQDVLATLGALRQLGVGITAPDKAGCTTITGRGLGAFAAPPAPLDLGNSGTGARLLMGVVAGAAITASFMGDASLSVRPMGRIIAPLRQMGARFMARDGNYLPLTLTGTDTPLSIDWHSTIASAQVKSAILLAALSARGITSITEPTASRDHSERMLAHFGAEITSETHTDGRYTAYVKGEADLTGTAIRIPADPSSAAFAAVAALITAHSAITIPNVGLNPLRFGLYESLIEMGADISISNQRIEGGEPVGDITCRSSQLSGIDVPESRAASMIDEYPILAIAAACAEGTTTMCGIGELRVKETDRIAMTEQGLLQAGAEVKTTADSMTIKGSGGKALSGGFTLDACHDHRIAMAFLVCGLASSRPISVSGAETINTSFPNFAALMQNLGADIKPNA